MASGLEKLAAQMRLLPAELAGLAGSLAPKETSRVSSLLAWSSALLTWGRCPSAGGWDTRGRKEPFPSPTRKGQGQTGSVSFTGLGWQWCAFTGDSLGPAICRHFLSKPGREKGNAPTPTLGFSPSKQENEVFIGIHSEGGRELHHGCPPSPRVPTSRQEGTLGSRSGSRRLVTLASPRPAPEASL